MEIERLSFPQAFTHMEQAPQSDLSMTGFSHSVFETLTTVLPILSNTAELGQTLPQTPQFTHRAGLIAWSFFSSPDIALTGQFLAHRVQPVHDSVIKNAIGIPPICNNYFHNRIISQFEC
jgi:hypothetical protein